MTNFYKRYLELCVSAGKTPSAVAAAIGLSNAAATGWKNGKLPSDVTVQKLSRYFGVTAEQVLGLESASILELTAPAPVTQTAPAQGERSVTDAELKFALWGDCEDISDDDLEDVRRYAAFVRERKKERK